MGNIVDELKEYIEWCNSNNLIPNRYENLQIYLEGKEKKNDNNSKGCCSYCG